jgi:hypothetical protein
MDPLSIAMLASQGASLLGNLFGGDEGGQASPTGINGQTQGFAALPPEVQQAWLQQYLPQLLQQHQGKLQTTPLEQARSGPFESQGLQELQDYANRNAGIFGGSWGVRPLGQVEPLNQIQQGALGNVGRGLAGLSEDLPGYQSLYNQNVLDPQLKDIQRQQDIAQNNLLGAKAGTGNLGALGSSALGTQLAQNLDNYNRQREQARAAGYQHSIGLRNQTLQQMLSAGNQVQAQGQQQLSALQPQLQATAQPQRLEQLAAGLQRFPASQVTQGQTPSQPDFLNKVGFGGQALGGFLQGSGAKIFGDGGQQQPGVWGQSLGNQMPWLS